MQAWGSEFHAPDHGIYEFSNGARKDSTDRGKTGLYGVRGDTLLLLDGRAWPDMREALVVGVGTAPGAANNGFGSYQEIAADPV